MAKRSPSPAEPNGRDTKGRFQQGNKAGKGNPNAARAQQLRHAMLAAVTTKDIRDVIRAMVRAAKNGDAQAAKLVLDRSLGPVTEKMELALEHSGQIVMVEIPQTED